jgi:hypothetical protein
MAYPAHPDHSTGKHSNLVRIEGQGGIQVKTDAPATHQVGDPPGDDHEQGQRAFELSIKPNCSASTRHAFFSTRTAFRFPTSPDTSRSAQLRRCGCRPLGSSTIATRPVWRQVARRSRVHDTGRSDCFTFAGRQFDMPRPQLLAHRTRFRIFARWHQEADFAQRRAISSVRPQFIAIGQATVALGVHKLVGGSTLLLGRSHQRHQVRSAIGDIQQARAPHVRRHLSNEFLAFNPTHAFFRKPRSPSASVRVRAHIQAFRMPSGSRSDVTASVGCTYMPRWAS